MAEPHGGTTLTVDGHLYAGQFPMCRSEFAR